MSLDGIEKTLNHLHARYLSIDKKLDAIAKRAAKVGNLISAGKG